MGNQAIPAPFARFSKPKILKAVEQTLHRDTREQIEDKRRERRDILISILIVVFFLAASGAFLILHFPSSDSTSPTLSSTFTSSR